MAQNDAKAHRVAGIAAVVLFAVFAGNIMLVKAGAVAGFSTPRLSTVWEFLIMLATTFMGVAYLIGEERLKKLTEEERL